MAIRYAAGLLLVLLFALGGVEASSQPVTEPKAGSGTAYTTNLNLLIRTLEGEAFIDRHKISDPETVKSVIDRLRNVPWERAKVSMCRLPDYKIVTVNTDPTVSYEPAIYDLWLTPSGKQLEISIAGKGQYGKMSEADSAELLAILQRYAQVVEFQCVPGQ
ncbi:hypothetical protein D3P08_17490 [Paenibacillus nanensis]|uniref:Uncharacterized protein n=1 Tax=Paenibacillus nanensis TaxID=393251 RepID=A0A3A1UUZ1_9BACL|nr:hypothetical protein [Paenibacillus nanensis]RIX51261.1 hypothetical protein D3P08_17490 [Paenibacillus nanensis]